MCYVIPARLIAFKNNNIGVVDYFGEHRNVFLDDLQDIKIGDYVYAQGGIVVRRIPTDEALSILETWKEVFFELKKTDDALSKIDQEKVPQNILGVLQKVNLRKTLKPEELQALFQLNSPNELAVLYEIANNIRHKEHGNASCIHGIIEFSNYCQGHCHYCGIRQERKIKRYRMSIAEVVAAAKRAVDDYGFKALVLQSGEDHWYTDAKLIELVKAVRALGTLVFVSIGSRSVATYKKLYAAGARAALLRFETSNPDIFARLRPNTTLTERLNLIKSLKEIGYILATGFILGLPGETKADRVNNILLTKSLNPDMYSFGPLIPTHDTPLQDVRPVTKEDLLKTIAIGRLADSNSNILVTTAMETLDESTVKEGLLAGGNSMMINVTPDEYKYLYEIYDKHAETQPTISTSIQKSIDLLHSLGRAPADLIYNKTAIGKF